MAQLLTLIGQHLDERVLDRLALTVRQDPGMVRRVVDAGVPVLIGALARNALKDESEAMALAETLDAHYDGAVVDAWGQRLLEGAELPDRKALDGDGILDHAFGRRREPVESGLGRAVEAPSTTVRAVMTMLAPLVMDALSREKRRRGLDVVGLKTLLEREGSSLTDHGNGRGRGMLGFLDGDDPDQVSDDVAGFARNVMGGLVGA